VWWLDSAKVLQIIRFCKFFEQNTWGWRYTAEGGGGKGEGRREKGEGRREKGGGRRSGPKFPERWEKEEGRRVKRQVTGDKGIRLTVNCQRST